MSRKSDDENDALAWIQLLAGDHKAYSDIYRKYTGKLFDYGVKFTSDRELVRDCIHDLFVKIYAHRQFLKPTDNVRLYLFIALKNHLFNAFHKAEAYYQFDSIEPEFSVEYSEASAENEWIANEEEEERKVKIARIFDMLTPRQKEAIHYRYVEGFNLTEVGELMKMNYQSVQNLLQRSVKRVRMAYGESEEDMKTSTPLPEKKKSDEDRNEDRANI